MYRLGKRWKLYLSIGGLLSILVLCLLSGFRTITWYQSLNDCHASRSALRSLEVTIAINQQLQLIEQFNKFADQNDFRSHISYYTPKHEQFGIELIRKDVEITVFNPFARGEFEVGFYNNDCAHPTIASDLDRLVSELIKLVSEIPSVTITEK